MSTCVDGELRAHAFVGSRAALWVVLLLGSVLQGCSRDAAVQPSPALRPKYDVPPLPELALESRLPGFEARAAKSVADVPAAKRQELVEYFELAHSESASGRTQHRARSAFTEAELAPRVLEWITTEHEDARLRALAAFELGERRTIGATTVLLKRLKYEVDATARVEVGAALVRLGVESGYEPIDAALRDPGHVARERAGTFVLELAKEAAATLPEQPTWEQLQVFVAARLEAWRQNGVVPAGAHGDDATAEHPLRAARLARLFVDLQGFQLRPVDDARFMLARAGKLGFDDLRLALGASEVHLRNHALEVLRGLGKVAHELRDHVRPLLADPLSRSMALRVLGAIEDREALPWCRELLNDSDLEVRVAAATALGTIADAGAKYLLFAIANDEAEVMDLRVAAAASLARLELERPWWRWLVEARKAGSYHKETLDELLDSIDAEVDRSRRR